MIGNIKTEIQLLIIILLAGITLTALSLFMENNIQAQTAFATPEPVLIIDPDTLAAFNLDLPANTIEAANVLTYNLAVVKASSHITVNAGAMVTFTIAITNHGPNAATGIFFQDRVPAQMDSISYTFSAGSGAINNGATNPQELVWLFTNPITSNNTVLVTVTGRLTSTLDVTVTNTALITSFNAAADTTPGNNNSSVQVGIAGSNPNAITSIYLPIISRFPTPTPVPIVLAYSENFSSNNAWVEFDSGGCSTDNSGGQYHVSLDKTNKTCFPPAKNENKPESPYRTYGEFEVEAYHSEGTSSASYGIFINGQGGDNYYLFRIWPNNGCNSGGDWQLFRKKNGTEDTITSKTCDIAIKRGMGSANTNILRIAHKSDRTLILYINGIQVWSGVEPVDKNLTGTATGVYVRSANVDVLMKFDNFKVYKYP